MNFLKSAVASAIAQGPPFPYTFGDKVDVGDSSSSIWTLYNGTRREDGSNCSIFSFDVTSNKSRAVLAKNALKKLRTMRHPGVIRVLDAVETETYIYIATERVVPLRWHVKRKSLSPETIKWGLYSIATTVKFINDEGNSIHGNLKVGSVYTSESGEWKLGGFECLSRLGDDDAVIYTYGSLVPDSGRYTAPELARNGWDAIKKSPHTAVDSFNMGTLIFEVFNGDFMGTDQAGQTKSIPPTMHASYKRLANANPKARITVGAFLEQGKRSGAFFDSPLIKLTEGVDNLGVKSEEEREEFLNDLGSLSDDFPEDFFKMKVLPELLKSVEFGGGGPKAFEVVMKISTKLSSDDFETKVQPVVVRLFGNPDRAIRVCLLDNLPLMIDRLPQKTVNDKIFPHLVTGFTDLAPVVREQTLKSVLVIIGKLSDRVVNGELLKYLAKTANDEQPGIRTNTTICLGKIAKNLNTSTRSKVLIAAFTRSLRDPFVHARNAALMALAATSDSFSDEDCAAKVMPAICPSLIDKEKMIRDQAVKTLDVYMQKIRKAVEKMPDTVLPPQQASEGAGPRMATPVANETSSWAGWAISSFTNKLSTAAGEIQPSASNGTNTSAARITSPTPGGSTRLAPTTSSSVSNLHRQAVNKSPRPSTTLSRTSSTSNAEAYFKDAGAAEDDDLAGDAWGDLADMDDGDAWGDPDEAPSTASAATTSKPALLKTLSPSSVSTSTPYDDGSEPDFAGWLAAQAQKKTGGAGAKGLPKGLTKSASSPSTVTKKSIGGAAAASKKPLVVGKPKKEINLKVKQAADDEDGWGDGW